MKDKKYINLAIKAFSPLQKKYELKLVVKDTVLSYSSRVFSFSVYFEKHFEYYVCFHLKHTDLRLYDIAVWLGFEENDIILLTKNQIANEHDAKFVLKNLIGTLEKLLEMLKKNPELLFGFLEYQKQMKKKYLLESSLLSIQKAWETKQFEKFLILLDLNRNIIEQSKSAEMIFKQEAYIKKLRDKATVMLPPDETAE